MSRDVSHTQITQSERHAYFGIRERHLKNRVFGRMNDTKCKDGIEIRVIGK